LKKTNKEESKIVKIPIRVIIEKIKELLAKRQEITAIKKPRL